MPDLDLIKQGEQGSRKKRPLVAGRPFSPHSGPLPASGERESGGSAVPAERLRLAGGALGDYDVDEGGPAEAHRLIEGAA